MHLKIIGSELKKQSFLPLIFFIIALFLLIKYNTKPINDYGNYYYGSKLFIDNKFSLEVYKSIYHFNKEIANYGEKNYFSNYTPVPVFSVLFYTPLAIFKSNLSKVIFNFFSAILFCIALYRLIKFCKVESKYLLFLPFILFIPLKNNIIQGQSYLLIFALLSESFIQSEKNKVNAPAIFIALAYVLKIFPAFFLLYFLVKRKYNVVLLSIVYFLAFNFITFIFIGSDVILYYYTHIIPRLLNNDIIGTYHATNQSFYSLLLTLFSSDQIHNPKALLFDFPLLVPIIESICIAVFVTIYYTAKNSSNFFLFGLTSILLILTSRYNTSYATILLTPFLLVILADNKKKFIKPIAITLFFISLSVSIGNSLNASILLQYSRLITLTIAFILLIKLFELELNFKILFMVLFPLLILKITLFSTEKINYFYSQNTKGILYDTELKNDSIVLYSTLGEKTSIEKFPLLGKARIDSNLKIIDTEIVYKNKKIYTSKDNKKNPFIYNDTMIVFMSDLNQGIFFYKLRSIPLLK